ncbi:hypothetical protein CYL17_13445 [Thermobispora bispora]|nr:hypothetical protein [Actinomycetales bacterium]QSI48742.1 hypothetical protein CYL17_13445 [Thermobispora bispora]
MEPSRRHGRTACTAVTRAARPRAPHGAASSPAPPGRRCRVPRPRSRPGRSGSGAWGHPGTHPFASPRLARHRWDMAW